MDNIEDILRALAEDAPEDSGSKDEVSQDGGLFSGLDLGSMAKIHTALHNLPYHRRYMS